jgi:hypothetical protein
VGWPAQDKVSTKIIAANNRPTATSPLLKIELSATQADLFPGIARVTLIVPSDWQQARHSPLQEKLAHKVMTIFA